MNKTAFILFSTDRQNKAIANFPRETIALLKPNYYEGFFSIIWHIQSIQSLL